MTSREECNLNPWCSALYSENHNYPTGKNLCLILYYLHIKYTTRKVHKISPPWQGTLRLFCPRVRVTREQCGINYYDQACFLISKIFWFFGAIFQEKLLFAKHRNKLLWALSVGQSGVDTPGNEQNLVSKEFVRGRALEVLMILMILIPANRSYFEPRALEPTFPFAGL